MTSQELSGNQDRSQSGLPEMPTEWATFVHNIVTQLTRENVALTYDLNNITIAVPSSSSKDSKAQWIINGSITIRGTRGT